MATLMRYAAISPRLRLASFFILRALSKIFALRRGRFLSRYTQIFFSIFLYDDIFFSFHFYILHYAIALRHDAILLFDALL